VPVANVKVAVLIVEGSMSLLNVALTAWLRGTLVAAFAGTVTVTCGAPLSTSVPVVKVQGFGAKPPPAKAMPARSFAPAVTVAVKRVLAAKLLAGVKVAIAPA
jgi:hypothetical protein